ncbi:MAG: 6,7-dimethyl-8-ribityllumazine synthase, partial [Thiohalomonadales bacterium]
MSDNKIIEGSLQASGAQFALIATRFNNFIVQHLLDGAEDTLKRHGAEDK